MEQIDRDKLIKVKDRSLRTMPFVSSEKYLGQPSVKTESFFEFELVQVDDVDEFSNDEEWAMPLFVRKDKLSRVDEILNAKLLKVTPKEDSRMEEIDIRKCTCSVIPDVVTRNKGFFGALAQVGIKPLGCSIDPVEEPHARRFDLLEGVAFLMGPYGHINTFMVPPLTCETMTESMYKGLSFYYGGRVVGNTPDVCYGMREKLDGIEVVVFGVYYDTGVHYYMWEGNIIREVRACQPFHAEKVGDMYHILTEPVSGFVFEELDGRNIGWKIHEWMVPSVKILESAKEGVILNVNFREYKVVRENIFTYRVENDMVYDSTRKIAFPVKTIYGYKKIENGLYDLVINSAQLIEKVVKRRDDKVYPDSWQQIDVIRRKCIRYSLLHRYHVLPDVMLSAYISIPNLHFEQESELMLVKREDVTEDVETILCNGSISKVNEVLGLGIVVESEYKELLSTDRGYDLCVYSCPSAEVKWDLEARPYVGSVRQGNSSVEDRNYISNVKNTNVIAEFISTRKSNKGYLSWSDLFCVFRDEVTVPSMVLDFKIDTKKVKFKSPLITLGMFDNWCAINGIFLKNGYAYILSPSVRQQNMGMCVHGGRRLLRVRIRFDNGYIPYRGFFLRYEYDKLKFNDD